MVFCTEQAIYAQSKAPVLSLHAVHRQFNALLHATCTELICVTLLILSIHLSHGFKDLLLQGSLHCCPLFPPRKDRGRIFILLPLLILLVLHVYVDGSKDWRMQDNLHAKPLFHSQQHHERNLILLY